MDQPVQAPRPLALAAVAVAAALLYQFLLLFPLALMFGLPALWFGSSYLLWASALGFLVMAWVAQPASGSPPQALARADAPDLYRVVDGIADRLNAPRPHAIALDDALNAGALELNRGLSLRPTRRVLVLGRPLLALLDPDALAAVVAHEFGHFSRHHGRLGHWLYRTRLAWMDYVEAANEPDLSAWERAGAAFGQRFVPWFAKASFAHARCNEYEADALAAQACGAAALARALQQIHVLAARWEPTREALRIDMQRQHAEPPADWLPQLAQRLREAASAETTEPERRSDDADPHATHPSLAARLQALSATPQPMGWPAAEACAGAAWLGPGWPAEAIDSRWASAGARQAWRCGHVLLQHGDGLHEPGPEAVRHRQALALLADGGDAAAARALLQSLLETAPSWAVPVRTTLAAHAQTLGLSPAERSENRALMQRALERREAAAGLMREARQRGEFTPPPLSAAARTALAQALAAHPVLQAAWCLGLAARLDERRNYRGIALVLRADPLRLEADALSAEQLADSAADLLAPLCDADTVVMVPLRYTTESVPEELAARPETLLFSR